MKVQKINIADVRFRSRQFKIVIADADISGNIDLFRYGNVQGNIRAVRFIAERRVQLSVASGNKIINVR